MKFSSILQTTAFGVMASLSTMPIQGKVAINPAARDDNDREPTSAYSLESCAISLKKCLKNLKELNPGLEIKREIASLSSFDEDEFTLEELYTICNAVAKKVSQVEALYNTPAEEELKTFLASTVKELKDYKVSGIGFAHHGDASVFYGSQNFKTSLQFKNKKSQELFDKGFNLNYSSIGLQAKLAYRFDLIFVVGTDFNRFNARAPIDLGRGFTGVFGPIFVCPGITMIQFAKQPGCIVIVHCGIGLQSPVNFALVPSGGRLTPLDPAQ